MTKLSKKVDYPVVFYAVLTLFLFAAVLGIIGLVSRGNQTEEPSQGIDIVFQEEDEELSVSHFFEGRRPHSDEDTDSEEDPFEDICDEVDIAGQPLVVGFTTCAR